MEGSANGFILGYSNGYGSWEFRATWPAPYFVFVDGMVDADDGEPLGLIHCDDLDHALRHVRLGGKLLDSSFVEADVLVPR
jgi:hypothetical protein